MADRSWPSPQGLPPGVRAWTTTRCGGISAPPYDSLNLAVHSGDDAAAVAENRRRLMALAGLPEQPRWLDQVHGTTVVAAHRVREPVQADAAWTDRPGVVCAVLTADCLPVVFFARQGSVVAVAHAGWRGLCDGVLEATVAALPVAASELDAWIGPAIGRDAFQVGPEVVEAFVAADPDSQRHFGQGAGDRWYAGLAAIAAQRLRRCNVAAVAGGEWCTYADPRRFYSYRRDGVTGRMATLIVREG